MNFFDNEGKILKKKQTRSLFIREMRVKNIKKLQCTEDKTKPQDTTIEKRPQQTKKDQKKPQNTTKDLNILQNTSKSQKDHNTPQNISRLQKTIRDHKRPQ